MLEDQLQLQRRSTALLALLAERGIVAREELARAEADLAAAQSGLPMLRAARLGLLNGIDALLGQAPGSVFSQGVDAPERPATLPQLGKALASGHPVELLSRRPDVLAAQAQAQAATMTVGQTERAYYPTFSLGTLVGSAAGGISKLLSSDGGTAQGLLGIRWRLFDFARIEAEIAASRGQYRESLAQFRLAALRAAHEVEDAVVQTNAIQQQLQQLTAAQQSAQRAQESARRAYAQGAVSERDLILTQRALLASDTALLRSQAEQQQSFIRVYRTLGGGWKGADAQDKAASSAVATATLTQRISTQQSSKP